MGSEIIYPGGIWEPLPRALSTTPLAQLVIDVHTMVTTIEGCRRYFSAAGNPYSHFGLPDSGPVRQWQDLRFRAASDYQGNSFCISIETEDTGPPFPTWSGSDVPAWTAEQVERLAQLIAWLCVRFGIPPVLLGNSLPGQAGASYHRLGIDPYRVQGGVRYSTSYGKACPGDRRIAQMRSAVMPRVLAIIAPLPVPTPPEDEMDFRLYHPNDTFWLCLTSVPAAIQISSDAYHKMDDLNAYSLVATDCDAIIARLNATVAADQPAG